MPDSNIEPQKKKQKSIFTNMVMGQIIEIVSIAFFGLTTLWQTVSSIFLPMLNNDSSIRINLSAIKTNLTVSVILGVLLLALLVLNIIRAYVRYKHGIEEIINCQPEYKDIIEQIRKAKNEIKIMVYHGENLLKAVDGEIISAINKPKSTVTVKLLSVEEKSDLLKEVWDLEERDENEKAIESNRIKIARSLIQQIQAKTKANPHRFDWLEYNTQGCYSIIIVDNKWAWWTPHHPGVKVENTTSMTLSKQGGDSIILECIDHFERLWSRLDKKRQNAAEKQKADTKQETEEA